MPLEVPPSLENESPPALSVDLLESDSVIDLLQASSNEDMFYLTDDVPFFNPTSIVQSMIPSSIAADARDIVRQDALIGSYFQNSLGNADTDATYINQYTTSSALSETSSVDDVFIPPSSRDPSSAIQHVFAKPVRPPPNRIAKPLQRPNLRATNQYVINPLVSSQKDVLKNVHVRGQVSKSRSASKTNSRTPIIKGALHVKPPTRISVVRNNPRRSNHQNILLISRPENALSSTRAGSIKCTSAPHTVTRTVDAVTESPFSFTSVTNSSFVTTAAQTTGKRTLVDLCRYTSRAQYLDTTDLPCSVTSTVTSQTASKAKVAATVAPTQSTFAVPLYPSPMIIARPPSPSDIYTEYRCTASSATKKDNIDCTQIPTTEMTSRSCTKLTVPVTSETFSIVTTSAYISHTATIPRVCASMRKNPSAVTNMQTSSPNVPSAFVSRRPYAVVPTRSTCPIPPGATLYAPTTIPSLKTSRLRAVPVTTACQKFAIDNGMGSYTTLAISPDIAQNKVPSPVTTIQSTATSTSVAVSDSTHVRSRSQLLIPIASTSTGISYLMTSTISSLPEVTQAPSSPAVGSHITTIRSDASNRTRTRLILPVAQNVSSTMVGLGSAIDSHRSRNTLAIISPQISSALETSGNTGINTIRAFAIAKPQNASSFLSPNSDHVTKSQSIPTAVTETSGSADSDDLSSITALLTSDISSSSKKTSESVTRPLSRIFMPFIQSTSNTQNSASVGSTANHVTSRILTPSTYILTSAMGTSASPASVTPKPSQRVVIPLIHSSVATVTTATTSTTARPFTSDIASSMLATTDVTSRLRNRLLVPTVSTAVDSDSTDNTAVGNSSITAFTITRGRSPLTSVPTQSGLSRSSESFNPLSSSTTHNMFTTNTAYISFATTTVATTVTASHSTHSPSVTTSDHAITSTPTCIFTTATPTLTSTGHRYVIKLSTTQSASSPTTSTVTVATTTPITTSTISPPEHQFLEPPSASRLRTFPGPRTYSLAQRNVSKSERNVSPRPAVSKRIITTPAPLQIFPDIVCPQSMSSLATNSLTHNQYGQPRFTLSQSAGSSTLIVPQYKNTVFKNLSTIAHPVSSSMRLPTAQASAERLILKRSVTCVAPRRSFPATQVTAQRATTAAVCSVTQRTRFTYGDSRTQPSPKTSLSPDSVESPATSTATNTLPSNASDDIPKPEEQYNEHV